MRSFWCITAQTEIVGAFFWLEDDDELADQVLQPANCAHAYLAQHCLEAGESHLNQIAVRAARRKEAQMIGVLKEAEAGVKIADLSRSIGGGAPDTETPSLDPLTTPKRAHKSTLKSEAVKAILPRYGFHFFPWKPLSSFPSH